MSYYIGRLKKMKSLTSLKNESKMMMSLWCFWHQFATWDLDKQYQIVKIIIQNYNR